MLWSEDLKKHFENLLPPAAIWLSGVLPGWLQPHHRPPQLPRAAENAFKKAKVAELDQSHKKLKKESASEYYYCSFFTLFSVGLDAPFRLSFFLWAPHCEGCFLYFCKVGLGCLQPHLRLPQLPRAPEKQNTSQSCWRLKIIDLKSRLLALPPFCP